MDLNTISEAITCPILQDIMKDLSVTDLKIKDFYRLKIGE